MPANRPFTNFNFLVEIRLEGVSDRLCAAAFAECDGLEMTLEPKTFHQGGMNTEQVHLAGPISYGQITLKRGMSNDFGLWRWFSEVMKTEGRSLRGQGTVVMHDGGRQPQMTFKLKDCLPVKLHASALNAKEGGIAIEELQLVCGAIAVEFDSPQLGLNIQGGASLSLQANIGL